MTPLGPPLTSPEAEARIRGELCTSGSIFKRHESGVEAIVVYPCIDKYSRKGRVKFKVLAFQTVPFQDTVAQEDLSRGPSPSLPPFHWEGSWVWIWVQPSPVGTSQLHPYAPHYTTNSTRWLQAYGRTQDHMRPRSRNRVTWAGILRSACGYQELVLEGGRLTLGSGWRRARAESSKSGNLMKGFLAKCLKSIGTELNSLWVN